MTLQEAIDQGYPLQIIEDGAHRPVAGLVIKDGLTAWADFGWDAPLNGTHPFHVRDGELDLTEELPVKGKGYEIEWAIVSPCANAWNRDDLPEYWKRSVAALTQYLEVEYLTKDPE